jgi:predicted AAA+ superfamily ATPase
MTVSRETKLETFGRDEFLNERFRYGPDGPHITIVGPTRCGKSYLAQSARRPAD